MVRCTPAAEGSTVLKLAFAFFIVSLLAGFFGFSGLSIAAAGTAKILFVVAAVAFVGLVALALFAGSIIL
jgi:uncharacterized membrane protein YtjA (UPF0391 family)